MGEQAADVAGFATLPRSGAPTAVLINARAGTAQQHPHALTTLQLLVAERLPNATVEVIGSGTDLTDRVRAAVAAGAHLVAVAGGDGSVNAAAQALVGTPVRLGVLPFGTYNHFARDLAIPLELPLAVDLLATPPVRRIDVGAANNHYFVNNASLGLYPALVALREQQGRALAKPFRVLKAAGCLVRTAKPLAIEVRVADRPLRRLVWLLFVGNNVYNLDLFQPGYRQRLDAGRLDVVIVRVRRRWDLVPLVRGSLQGSLQGRPVLRLHLAELSTRPLHTTRCPVALDGEVRTMAGPVVFRSVPAALWVVAPPA